MKDQYFSFLVVKVLITLQIQVAQIPKLAERHSEYQLVIQK